MKKSFYTTLLLLLVICVQSAFAQEYYWVNDKKYPVELYPGKHYILTHTQNKQSIVQTLGIDLGKLSEMKQLTISKGVRRSPSNLFSNHDDFYWGFVNESISIGKIHSSEIIYTAPSFRINGKEVGLSNFFYVRLRQEQDVGFLKSLAKENNVEIVGNDNSMPLWFILSCDMNSKGNALEMANLFYETGNFISAEPDWMVDYGVNCRNDTFFNQQWHLNNTGQYGGTVENDTRACQAWDITAGSADILVAVLDHGLEFNHPDFDNISPISFDSDTGTSPSVVRGNHGVAVAGIIGASANNGLGVAGIAPNIQLMSVSNSLTITPLASQRLASGINFAWENGADVINNSWGSNVLPQQGLINDAINNAVTQGRDGLGTVVIFASGNDNNCI